MTSSDDEKYYAVVVDSGAIIKHTGFQTLHNASHLYFSPSAVLEEIRDQQARQHLQELPFPLQIREPSTEGLKKVIEFSQRTGDYASLSSVDLQVLALVYDLEKEGCHGNIDHIRNEPTFMKKAQVNRNKMEEEKDNAHDSTTNEPSPGEHFFDHIPIHDRFEVMSIGEDDDDDGSEEEEDDDADNCSVDGIVESFPEVNPTSHDQRKTWAMIVNPTSTQKKITTKVEKPPSSIPTKVRSPEGADIEEENEDNSLGGQFSDAEEDGDVFIHPSRHQENMVDDDSSSKYNDSDVEISDEECDAYILDPDEAVERKRRSLAMTHAHNTTSVDETEFPILTSSAIDESGSHGLDERGRIQMSKWEIWEIEEAERRAESLKPISADGKLYESFRKYKNIIPSTGIDEKYIRRNEEKVNQKDEETSVTEIHNEPRSPFNDHLSKDVTIHSRIMGGTDLSGQGMQVNDDGEGWITCVKDIHARKVSRALDPAATTSQFRPDSRAVASMDLPSRSQRAACATTDFAMQNVMLQMNLELLTVDGVRVRKLKSWVFRCAACFTVYTGNETSRLFCGRCGSPSLQRIAASVDGRTGQFRLHLKKNYRYNLRGTQFNLPAPGKGNKFKGDLLLREDQLLYGAWSQKVKSSKTQRDSQCIFGADITSSLGCSTDLLKRDDIKVGFGGKNPNASKFGRERRGKKKKSAEDKACGLRRY